MKNSLYLKISITAGLFLAALFLVPYLTGNTAKGSEAAQETGRAAVGTGFTYQGYLTDSNGEANGAYDFQFRLYDADSLGVQVGSTAVLGDVPVSGGIFSVELDFGASAFGGGGRWLEIDVRAGSSIGAYTTLVPRQKLTPSTSAQAMPNVFTNESTNFVGIGRDFRISGNEVFGIRYTGSPNQYGGMYVETSSAGGWPFYGYATNGSFRAWTYYNGTTGDWSLYSAGIRLKVPASGGLRIGPALDYSLVISNTTGSDGIRILDTGDDAIQIGSNPDIPNYGVYIPSPGVSTYGLWSNTSNASGQWALYSVDNIQAGNVVASAFSLVAQVTGPNALTPGDVVAVAGMADPLPGGVTLLPMVRLAGAPEFTGVIGVVESRMVWEAAPGKELEGEKSMHSADGPAQPGDYVSLIVYGVAQVKVSAATAIHAGDRLTVSDVAGQARPLQARMVDGMMVVEGAPVIGIALSEPVEGQDTIYVFVTLR